MVLRGGDLIRLLFHLFLLRPLFRLVFGYSVMGRENLKGLSRFIIVANHNSHLDAVLLFCVLPLRLVSRTRPVAARDYFGRSGLFCALLDMVLRPVWIDRGEGAGRAAIEEMDKAIREGDSLIVFPEGTRGEPGEMGSFKSGVGRLAVKHANVPLVPAFISGPERALPKRSLLPLPILSAVTIGHPRVFTGAPREATEAMEAVLREIHKTEEAGRHRRHRDRRRGVFSLAVLGIDGSGKSTVSRKLAQAASAGTTCAWISDRLELFEGGEVKELQPLITEEFRKLVGSGAKRAKTLKLYMLPKLVELLMRERLVGEIERWYAPEFIVQDGSPLLNLAAWSVLYKGEFESDAECREMIEVLGGEGDQTVQARIFGRYPELRRLKRLGLTGFRRPDLAILLDAEPGVALERIMRRGEDRQAHENAGQLARLRESYRRVCRVAERELGVPVLTVDADEAPERIAREGMKSLAGIRSGGRG